MTGADFELTVNMDKLPAIAGLPKKSGSRVIYTDKMVDMFIAWVLGEMPDAESGTPVIINIIGSMPIAVAMRLAIELYDCDQVTSIRHGYRNTILTEIVRREYTEEDI